MLKKFHGFVFSVFLVFCLIATSGCVAVVAGAAVGAGGYAWVKSALIKEFDVSSVKLQEATRKALRDLDLDLLIDDSDRLTAKITSKFADGKSVGIAINAITERSSKIKIRVGWVGDKMKSEMILNAIESNL